MVGVAGRSQGCKTCRRRKVACDLQRPFCARCQRSWRQCEGYETTFINYAAPNGENALQSSTSGQTVSIRSAEQGNPTLNFVFESFEGIQQGNIAETWGVSFHPRFSRQRSFGHRQQGLRQRELHHSLVAAQSLSRPVPHNPAEVLSWHWIQWFTLVMPVTYRQGFVPIANFIPSRLGTSRALDQAVATVVWAFLPSRNVAGSATVADGAYLNAINQLRLAVIDKKASKTAETLCAAMLLQMWEARAPGEHGSWVAHAGGASRLVETRGPSVYNDPFDRAILVWLVPTIACAAIQARKKCFLLGPQWDTVMRKIVPLGMSSTKLEVTNNSEAHEDSIVAGLHLSAVLEGADHLTHNTVVDLPSLGSEIVRVWNLAQHCQSLLDQWRIRYLGEEDTRMRLGYLAITRPPISYSNLHYAFHDMFISAYGIGNNTALLSIAEAERWYTHSYPDRGAELPQVQSSEHLTDETEACEARMAQLYIHLYKAAPLAPRFFEAVLDGVYKNRGVSMANFMRVVSLAKESSGTEDHPGRLVSATASPATASARTGSSPATWRPTTTLPA